MTAGTTEMFYPEKTFLLELRVVKVSRLRIAGIRPLQSQQITGNVLSFLPRQSQVGHDGHLLDLKLMAVIRALCMIEIKNIRKTLLRIVLRTNILFLVEAKRPCSLSRIVDPANQIFVIVLFSNSSQIRGETPAQQAGAFTY